jgi:hypothetical protein
MIRTIVGSVAAGAALLACTATPAAASYAPRGRLTLTYAAEAGNATAAVKLVCNPAGGSHPEASQACATLKTTGADPAKIKPTMTMCMMLYAPVTAEITGTWRGAPVKWTHKYGNGCEMTRATGVLFKF